MEQVFATQQRTSQAGAILNYSQEAHTEHEEALTVGVLWTIRPGLGQGGGAGVRGSEARGGGGEEEEVLTMNEG